MKILKADVKADRGGIMLRCECPMHGNLGTTDASCVSLEFLLTREQAVGIAAQLMQALEPAATAPDAGGFRVTGGAR